MATFVVFHELPKHLSDKRINFASDTFKAALTNVAPSQSNDTQLSSITQISSSGGYAPVTLSATFAETGSGTGVWRFNVSQFSWTASGGNFDTARYVVIYDDTDTNKALVGYADYGTGGFTLTNGNSFTVTPGANGLIEIQV